MAITTINQENFDDQVTRSSAPVLLDFWAALINIAAIALVIAAKRSATVEICYLNSQWCVPIERTINRQQKAEPSEIFNIRRGINKNL